MHSGGKCRLVAEIWPAPGLVFSTVIPWLPLWLLRSGWLLKPSPPVAAALKLVSVSDAFTTFDLGSDVLIIYLAEDLLSFQKLTVCFNFISAAVIKFP